MTDTQRPIALRVEDAATAAAVRDRCLGAVDAGFDGVELPVCPPPLETPPEPRASARATLRMTGTEDGDENFPVIAVATQTTATEIDNAREELIATLSQAAELGARCLNLTLPPVVHPGEARGFARYQDTLNFAYQLFQRCRLDIEAAGVPVGIEAAVGGCFLSPVELREFIDAVSCWALGVCVDARRVEQVGSTADWLQTLTHRVQALRLHDSVSPDSTVFECLADGRPVIIAGDRPAKELRERLATMGCRARRA